MQSNEIAMNFNFKEYLDIKMTQSFASIRMSNISSNGHCSFSLTMPLNFVSWGLK